MRIEEGKFYRTRDGRKAGPAKLRSKLHNFWDLGDEFDVCHEADGFYGEPGHERNDLISEWTEGGPIRTETVTVRRLEPGVYGPLNLLSDRSADSFVRLALVRELHNSAELRELARVALEIAEYLENA